MGIGGVSKWAGSEIEIPFILLPPSLPLPEVTRRLRAILERSYMPGIADEYAKDASCYEVTLEGYPWSQESSYNLHARSGAIIEEMCDTDMRT